MEPSIQNNQLEESQDEENQEISQNRTRVVFDENGKKIIKLREMTDLEKQYFVEARKRHRLNLTKP